MIRVLVDADSCAKRVRSYLLSRAKKNQIELIFAANHNCLQDQDARGGKNGAQDQDARAASLPANVKMVVCPKESQAADKWILASALPGDLVITRDIPLAAALLQKNIRVINDFGKVFDKKNVERALKERELTIQMAALGLATKRRDSYGQKEFEVFAETFNKEMQS